MNELQLSKKLPELYLTKSDCSGCTACYATCPANAISMEPDEEGFLYPVINARNCTRCYSCLEVCPLKP